MSTEVGELVNLLTVGLHHAQLYFPDHPRVKECAETFAKRVGEAAAGSEDGSFSLAIVDGRLVHDGRVLLGPTLTAKRLIDAAVKLRCGGFSFQRGVRDTDVMGLLTACATLRGTVASAAEAEALLKKLGVASVLLCSAVEDAEGRGARRISTDSSIEARAGDLEALTRAVPEYQTLLEQVEVSHAASGGGREVDSAGARGIVERMLPDLLDRPSDLMGLARYPDFDSYTVGHSVRVSLLSVLVGNRFGFSPRMLVEIGAAGLLHDVGKGRVPDSILMKQGPLDDEERRVMRTHPVLGAEILLATKDVPAYAVAAAWGHHLRSDGKGYPECAPWAVTSRVTALIHVCDVFEALTAVRPYKPSWSPRRALAIMLSDPGSYDRSAFAAFVSAIGFYPPGSRVRLADGSEALVLRAGEHPGRPIVEVRRTPSGARVPLPARVPLDLCEPGSPAVLDFAEDDLVAPSPLKREGPRQSAHDIIEESGACVAGEKSPH